MRLQVVLLADPRVPHDRRRASGLDRGRVVAVAARAVVEVAAERVVHVPVVAHLVRPVVDGVVVAVGFGDAGATERLVGGADDAERRDATAVVAQGDVTGVVVLRADELTEHDLVAAERRAGAELEFVLREARRGSARTVGFERVGERVQLGLGLVVDEEEPHVELVVVDLLDAVEVGDETGEDVGRAPVVGERRIGEHREPVGTQRGADDRSGRRRRGAIGGGRLVDGRFALDERAVRVGEVAAEVARVHARVVVVQRVDVPRAARAANRRGDAERRDREPNRLVGVPVRGARETPADEGPDLGVRGREARHHHGRVLNLEAAERARRCREPHDGASTRRVRGGGEGRLQAGAVEAERRQSLRRVDLRGAAVAHRRRVGAGRAPWVRRFADRDARGGAGTASGTGRGGDGRERGARQRDEYGRRQGDTS